MAPIVYCIKNQRLKYLFYSNDHEPAHVHFRRTGEWEVKVKFLTCTKGSLDYERKTGRKLRSAEVQEILTDILPVKEQLYKEWSKKVLTKKS